MTFIDRNPFYINFISGTSYKRLNGTSFREVFKLITKVRPLIGSLKALILLVESLTYQFENFQSSNHDLTQRHRASYVARF